MTTTKLTESEVNSLKELETRNKAIVQEFGQIAIAEYNLEQRRERAENFIDNLRELEVKTAKDLENKYGKGTVNMATGEFNAIASPKS